MTDLTKQLTCEFNITKTDRYLVLRSPEFEDMGISLQTDDVQNIFNVLTPVLNMYYVLAGQPKPSGIYLTKNNKKPNGVHKSFKGVIVPNPTPKNPTQ